MMHKDEQILTELLSEKETAFRKLFDQYYMPLCLYSVQITDSLDVSEDIVQDFFITFWEKKVYKQIKRNLQHYLFYCIRNASLAKMKEKRIFFLEEVETEAYCLPEEEWEEEEVQKRHKQLFESLEQLPEQGLKVFEGIVLHGKKYQEVADELGISINSVKTQFSRALKRLRDSLNIMILLILKREYS